MAPEPGPRADVDALAPLAAVLEGRAETPDEVLSLIAERRLPAPSALAADGTPLFPRDLLRLADEAGGVEALRREFEGRYAIAADAAGSLAGPDDLDDAWEAYLSGTLGRLLRSVSPEDLVRHAALEASVAGLLEHPDPQDWRWADRLRARVDALEALERPATDDEERLADLARRRFPEAFSPEQR